METGPPAFCFNSVLVGGVPDTPQRMTQPCLWRSVRLSGSGKYKYFDTNSQNLLLSSCATCRN